MAMANSALSSWDSKFHYSNWRPVTAIRLAADDGNPLTTADPDWTPLIVTPPYPDYYSGHQSISGAAQEVLTAFFGKKMGFEAVSAGVTRSWRSFSEAADEANMSRIWAGIHFRFAQTDARIVAEKIAQYVLKNAARPRDDD